MPTRLVELTEGQSDLVSSLVESGSYDSAEEVVQEALDLLAHSEREDDETKRARLQAELQIGIDAIARGEYQEFQSVDDLVAHLERLGDDIISGKVEERTRRSGAFASAGPRDVTSSRF